MNVTINISYQSRNALDENLVEQEIKETIEGLLMSLRNQVMGITHSINFGDPVPAKQEVVEVKVETPQPTPQPIVEEVVVEEPVVEEVPVVEEEVVEVPVKAAKAVKATKATKATPTE
jgi:hypothetical protein